MKSFVSPACQSISKIYYALRCILKLTFFVIFKNLSFSLLTSNPQSGYICGHNMYNVSYKNSCVAFAIIKVLY